MSRAAAVKAKCIDCIYDPLAAGSKLVQTTLCSCYSCPLWPYRPKTKSPISGKVLRYYGITDVQAHIAEGMRQNGRFLEKAAKAKAVAGSGR